MRTYAIAMKFSFSFVVAMTLSAWAMAAPVDRPGLHLAQQGPAPADRSLGNGSMGMGEGIERLPDDEPDRDGNQAHYDQPEHGDTDTDMEHRPRRTLGDEADD